MLSLSAECTEVLKIFKNCVNFNSFTQNLWQVGMGVMNLTIYVPLLFNMLHTKFGQDTHSSFIKDAENVEMLFAVRTAIDKYNWLFCQFSHS